MTSFHARQFSMLSAFVSELRGRGETESRREGEGRGGEGRGGEGRGGEGRGGEGREKGRRGGYQARAKNREEEDEERGKKEMTTYLSSRLENQPCKREVII